MNHALTKVTIGIKTFLRDAKLFHALDDIRRTLPGIKIIVADDGHHTEEKDGIYADLVRDGHQVIMMPFDSGFGAKSNAIADALETEYLLVGSDDFDFSPRSVRDGVISMVNVLDAYAALDIVSGRVNGRPYEFDLREEDGVIQEQTLYPPLSYVEPVLKMCDLTVNFSLIRRRVLKEVRWDDDVKIGGGEHGAFFVDVKRRGFKVACLTNVNINEQLGQDDLVYRQFRLRALRPERPCFDRRGIRKYVMFSGHVDYEKS